MSILIPKENWYIAQGDRKPSIECIQCGCGILGDTAPHLVQEDGTVKNSVICQGTYPSGHIQEGQPCNFHKHVQLEGWNGGFIPR